MRPRALIATARPSAALRKELWAQAIEIRHEWLEAGITTKPADHSTTEEAIASIYARRHRRRPDFVWVPSPRAAIPYLEGLPTHEGLRAWLGDRRPPGTRPVASDIAAGLSRLRSTIEDAYTEPPADRPPLKREKGKAWPVLPPDRALDAGLPFQQLLTQGVRESLFRSLSSIYLPIRTALSHAVGPVPVAWYGQQDAHWIAYVDVLQRTGLAHLHQQNEFDLWATLARSAGWWWPGDHRCILVERPTVVPTEPLPGAWHEEIRPSAPIEYADGWTV